MAKGNAWFAVQGLDGTETYTRAGHFQVSQGGQLVTPTGLPVLSDGGAPIDIPPNATISLGADGTVTAKTGNEPPVPVARLKLATATADNPVRRMMIGNTVGPQRMGSAIALDVGSSNASRVIGPLLGGALLAFPVALLARAMWLQIASSTF